MTTPTRKDEGLSRREEMAISGSAMSGAPWGAAAATGGAVAVADLALHLVTGAGVGLTSISGSLSLGAVAFFVVAAAAAMARSRGRAVTWARSHPWRFALLPGVATVVVVFVLSVLLGGTGIIGGALDGLWHGAAAYALTGLAGSLPGVRKRGA